DAQDDVGRQRIIESLVHAAALEPPAGFSPAQLEQAVVDAVMGYLGATQAAAPAKPARKTARGAKA
ncbi:hypothetical protein FGX01_04085, partial [Xylella fastidiosa subsp. multiplex]|nr:hypothetical protein [Xylella fastidiosa subsp. multiplex]